MSELRADTITASDGTSPVTLTKQSAAKAFVRYDASSGAAVADSSLNLASITDNGTGNYTMVFSSSFSNGEFAFTTGTSVFGADGRIMFNSNDAPAAGSFRVATQNSSFSNTDVANASCTFHGDLA